MAAFKGYINIVPFMFTIPDSCGDLIRWCANNGHGQPATHARRVDRIGFC
jgi:hypothetical protein